MKSAHIEIFRDLLLRGPESGRTALREALIRHATGPWFHAEEHERGIAQSAGPSEEVIAFERGAGNGVERVGLVLWSRPEGFSVVNIVPIEIDELGPHLYNAALEDFSTSVAQPAAAAAGFTVEMTAAEQGLDNWLPTEAAEALRSFSSSANKATGSSHPMDRKRWFAFLLAVHRSRAERDTVFLVRWLTEVEGWSDDRAHALAIEYEFGLALLDEYDRSKV